MVSMGPVLRTFDSLRSPMCSQFCIRRGIMRTGAGVSPLEGQMSSQSLIWFEEPDELEFLLRRDLDTKKENVVWLNPGVPKLTVLARI